VTGPQRLQTRLQLGGPVQHRLRPARHQFTCRGQAGTVRRAFEQCDAQPALELPQPDAGGRLAQAVQSGGLADASRTGHREQQVEAGQIGDESGPGHKPTLWRLVQVLQLRAIGPTLSV
jgi:hypothetical protein